MRFRDSEVEVEVEIEVEIFKTEIDLIWFYRRLAPAKCASPKSHSDDRRAAENCSTCLSFAHFLNFLPQVKTGKFSRKGPPGTHLSKPLANHTSTIKYRHFLCLQTPPFHKTNGQTKTHGFHRISVSSAPSIPATPAATPFHHIRIRSREHQRHKSTVKPTPPTRPTTKRARMARPTLSRCRRVCGEMILELQFCFADMWHPQHTLCSFHLIGSDCFLHKSHLSAVLTLTQAYSDWVDSAARTWCRRRIQNHQSANSSAHKQSTAKKQLNATQAQFFVFKTVLDSRAWYCSQ